MTTKISVIGLGLIGGSIALRLNKFYQLNGYDINDETINYINDNNLFVSSSKISDIKESDVIILALYPNIIKEWIVENQKYIKENALIIDTSGVKKKVFEEVLPILRDDLCFVGAHPMAGLEKSGIRYAKEDLFENANLIIVKQCDDHNITEKIFSHLGFKNISYLTASQHDEVIGYLSQLTHVIALSLMNANDNPLLSLYSGDSFRDLTRIAKINETLWYELFIMNRETLINEIDSFINEMSDFKQFLIDDNQKAIKDKMILSTKRRIEFDKK